MSLSFCIIKHDTDHSIQLQERSDTAVDPIETQTSRPFQKTSKAKESRKRYPLSQLRQTVRLPTRENINLKEFKFPQAPQTPCARRYQDWTPGSAFEDTSLSSPTILTKRFRRRSHLNFSRSSRSQHADQPRTKAVGDESPSTLRREREVVKRRLFAGGSSHNTATSTRHSVEESGKPVEVATAAEVVEDEQWQPLCKIGQQEVPNREGPALAEEVQNHQEALIGQTLAEKPIRKSSLREWHRKTPKPSCRDAEPSYIVLDLPPGNATDSHTANRMQEWESMHEENEELEIADQNTDKETESSEGSSVECVSDEGDWETVLEPDDEDMLDVGEEQQHPTQRTPPSQPRVSTPDPNSSERQRVTQGHITIKYPGTGSTITSGQCLLPLSKSL